MQRVRPVFLLITVAAGVAAAVIPSVLHLRGAYAEARATHRLTLAHQLRDPAGLVPVRAGHDSCPGPSAVRCAYAAHGDVDALAAQARRSLSRVTDQAATLRCDTSEPPHGTPTRLCLVQAFDGAITVSVETHVRRAGNRTVQAGVDYRVDAS